MTTKKKTTFDPFAAVIFKEDPTSARHIIMSIRHSKNCSMTLKGIAIATGQLVHAQFITTRKKKTVKTVLKEIEKSKVKAPPSKKRAAK